MEMRGEKNKDCSDMKRRGVEELSIAGKGNWLLEGQHFYLSATFQVTKTTASISMLIFSQASSPTSKSCRTEILWINPRNQIITSAVATCP